MNSPTLDVVLPTFNNELTIRAAVEAVLDQTFRDFRLIIVNDASTDKTLDVVRTIEDERIVVLQNQVNLGPSASRNIAIAHTSAPFIAFVDGDDLCATDRFQRQLSYLQKNEKCMVLGSQVHSSTTGNKSNLPIYHWEISAYLKHRNCMAMPTIMIRREVINHLNEDHLFNPEARQSQDYELWLRLLASKGIRFRNLHSSTVIYDDTISPSIATQRDAAAKTFRDKFVERRPASLSGGGESTRVAIDYFFARLTTKVRGFFG